MKTKIVGILVCMLLIATAIIPIASSIETSKNLSPGVIDQEQTDTSEGDFLENGMVHYQQFENQGQTIEEVEVHIGHYYSGSEPMTLSIQKTLGTKLTFKTLTTNDIPDHVQDWVVFDLPDVALTRGDVYYIVIEFGTGSEYQWSGAHGDPYPLGASSHPDPDWDYAFRTIVDKSKPINMNLLFLRFLENHPHMFPILRHLLGF